MELNMATVDEKKYEKSKELDDTHTDRTTQHVKEEPKKQLVITRCQVSDMDKVKTAVKRPETAFEAHENPYTLTTHHPMKSLQPPKSISESAPVILPTR